MQKPSKIFLILGIVAGILVLGYVIGKLAASGSGSKGRTLPGNPETVESHPPGSSSAGRSPTNLTEAEHGQKSAIIDGEAILPAGLAPGILTNWEDKLEEIIGAEIDETNKVEKLFALFPHVPVESRSEVAQHLSNLVNDDGYAPLGELLKDPKLGDDTLDVLMADVLNRPNSLKLPQLFEVAQTPDHPKADEAKDILSLFLDEDFGTDWPKWKEKMAVWLKDNPD